MRSSAARRLKKEELSMYPYIANKREDEEYMLKTIGAVSIDELFEDIPESIRLKRGLNLDKAKSELEVSRYIKALADKNRDINDLVCFLGAGAYDHYIPSIIKHITSRSEFYTSYTPYQPEISQGTLQYIFEYQTMITNLTGMDVANASMYDGPTACAEAALMAAEAAKRKAIIVSKSVHPEVRKLLTTYMKCHGVELIEVEANEGVTNIEELKKVVNKTTAGVIVQNPNFFGIVEDFTEVEKIVHDNKALLIMNVEPISMAVLKTPGEIGADIVVGEGQPLGNGLNFGGPYLGFMATTTKYMRKMPGRIAGETVDVDGKRAYVLTLQAREQHIRREKATSNICSNQSLNALTAAVYFTTMGKQGLKEVAEQSLKKAHYAFHELTKSGKYKPLFNKPFFMEFALMSEQKGEKINKELLKNGILGGYELGRDYKEYKNSLLFCVTGKRTRNEIDNLVKVMEGI
jgi:glycine dehydrogenase subunit 1